LLSGEDIARIKASITVLSTGSDRRLLESLRSKARELKDRVRPIRHRTITALGIVATDAGENAIEFDPFLVQPVRVVDNFGETRFLEVISPMSRRSALLQRIRSRPGNAMTALLDDLGVDALHTLSPMIP